MRYFLRAEPKWSLNQFAILILLAASSALAKEPSIVRRPPASSPATDPLADRIVAYGWQLIKTFPNSSYNHKTHIDTAEPVCEVDCSGFVSNVLAELSPRHVAAIQTLKKRSRPLAEDFYSTFAAAPRAR